MTCWKPDWLFSHSHSLTLSPLLSFSISLHLPPHLFQSISHWAFYMCPSYSSQCFSLVTQAAVPAVQITCSHQAHVCLCLFVYVCSCMFTNACINRFVCLNWGCAVWGVKALTGDCCHDLYYFYPFAISSHTAAECERELLEYVICSLRHHEASL